MGWGKPGPLPAIDLAGSNLLACSLSDLPGAREAVDIAGESPDGYAPLIEAIATHSGVSPEMVATAGGCSGANFLAIAALVEAGGKGVIPAPPYHPPPPRPRPLGARRATLYPR